MESITLPSLISTGFDRDRYPSASKPKSDLEVWINGGITLPGCLKSSFIDQITHFGNEHLH
jgi:hypothetical protein